MVKTNNNYFKHFKIFNMNLNETVTISIETYEEMKSEINKLRQQVENKTIYKDILPPIYGYVALFVILIIYIVT